MLYVSNEGRKCTDKKTVPQLHIRRIPTEEFGLGLQEAFGGGDQFSTRLLVEGRKQDAGF